MANKGQEKPTVPEMLTAMMAQILNLKSSWSVKTAVRGQEQATIPTMSAAKTAQILQYQGDNRMLLRSLR